MMRGSDLAMLDRYRNLCKAAEAQKAAVREVRAKIQVQIDKINELEGVTRMAKSRYQQLLAKPGQGPEWESAVERARAEVATTEAGLTEAKGRHLALKGDLPKLEAEVPKPVDIETARRAAWEAIARDLQARVSSQVQDMGGKMYAAMLMYRADAPFTAVLTAMCPAPPSLQRRAELAAQLAKEYDIPA